MSVRATELRKGSVIERDGDLLQITEYHHSTPGNWRAIIQMKTRSLTSGQAGSIRAGSGDTFEIAFLDRRKCEYLYRESNGDCVFMDAESFEQFKNQSEALYIRMKLEENDGNVKRTAELLGMQRSHLYKKLDRYNLRS